MDGSSDLAARRALDAETLALPAPAAPDGNVDRDVAGLAALVDQAEAFLRQARAENTRRAYASDWKDFERWCAGRQVPACPAAPSTVALYGVRQVLERKRTLSVESVTSALPTGRS